MRSRDLFPKDFLGWVEYFAIGFLGVAIVFVSAWILCIIAP